MFKKNCVDKNTRILYFDALETLSIFLVVLVHNAWLNGNIAASIEISITSAAVPIFFMVHGALLLNKEFSFSKHMKRIGKVLMQLFAWMLIYLLLYLCCASSMISPGKIIRYFVEGETLAEIAIGHLWFIWALLSVYFIYPIFLILKNDDKAIVYLLGILFVFYFVVEEINVFGNFFATKLNSSFSVSEWKSRFSPFGTYGNCLFFFLAGWFIDKKLKMLSKCKNVAVEQKKKMCVFAVLLFIAGVFAMMIERKIQFGMFAYNWKPLQNQYYKIGTVMMAFGVFILFSQITFNEEKCGTLIEISKHTIDIFYIHIIFGRLINQYFFVQSYAGIVQNILRAITVLVLSYGMGCCIRKIPGIKNLLE